jgi:septal ring factor EnvC (AmiA/AmiB activator)
MLHGTANLVRLRLEEATEQFYNGLRMFGTDFEMISKLFPGRTRRQIKLKFVKEEKRDKENIKQILLGEKLPVDIEELSKIRNTTFGDPRDLDREIEEDRKRIEEEQAREKERMEEEERKRQEEAAAEAAAAAAVAESEAEANDTSARENEGAEPGRERASNSNGRRKKPGSKSRKRAPLPTKAPVRTRRKRRNALDPAAPVSEVTA